MGEYLAILGMGFTMVAIFFFSIALKLYKPPVPRKKEPETDRDGESINDTETTGIICGTTLPGTDLLEDTRL